MSRVQNAVGVIETYVADVAVTMMFGLGYYLFKSLKKKEENTSWSTDENNMKTFRNKLEGALERWEYAKSVEEYHELIKSNYEGIEDPFAIINMMNKKGILPTIETYNALLLNCLITNKEESSELLKEEMLDPMGPVTPNKYTLNVLVKGLNLKYKFLLNKLKNENERKSLFQEFDRELISIIECMESRNVYMDLIVENTIMEGLIELGRLNEAWIHFNNMKKSFTPDLHTYSTLLKGIKQTPELSEEWLNRAFKILEEAKSIFELDENFFNSLLDSCVNFNRIDLMEELFEEMKQKKSEVSEFAYNIMIKGYGKVYKLDKAFEMFNEIKKKYINAETEKFPNSVTYGTILNACIRCKKIEQAEDLVAEMTTNQIKKNLYIYSTMISGYRKTRRFDKAIELYDYLDTKLKEGKENFSLNTVFFNSILDCCVDGHKYEKMDQIFSYFKTKSIEDKEFPQLDLITYSIVMKGYAKGNYIKEVTEMYSFLRTRKDFQLDEVVYNSLIDCYAKQNDEAHVLQIYSDMKANNMKMGVITYGVIIKLYCNTGDCNKAFEIFDECVKSQNKPTVVIYQMLIKLQIKSKFIDRAITLFRNMIVNQVKADEMIYELIINACLEQEREKDAAEFIQMAARDNIKMDKYIYDKLADKIYLSDNFTKTNEKFEITLTLLNSLKEKGILLEKSTHEKYNLILDYFNKHHRENNYQPTNTIRQSNRRYENKPYQTNKRNNFYSPNHEEKSIYDIASNNPANSNYNPNLIRNNNYVKNNYPYNNNNRKNNYDYYSHSNSHSHSHEEERSIYS